jgi:hypothetical protein
MVQTPDILYITISNERKEDLYGLLGKRDVRLAQAGREDAAEHLHHLEAHRQLGDEVAAQPIDWKAISQPIAAN